MNRILEGAFAVLREVAERARKAARALLCRGRSTNDDVITKLLDELIAEVAHRFVNAKKAVAIAIADRRRLAKRTEQETSIAAEWARRATMAEASGDESLAAEARARRQEHADLAEVLHGELERQDATVEQLKDSEDAAAEGRRLRGRPRVSRKHRPEPVHADRDLDDESTA